MKFGRKSKREAEVSDTAVEDSAPDGSTADHSEEPVTSGGSVEQGPFDADLIPDDGVARVDLGSLLIPPMSGKELRMQVDEKSGQVQAIALAGADGAMEVRAFAAPRNGDLWSEARPQIMEDMSSRGGTAQEREGSFGTELLCQIEVPLADGAKGTQVSRIVGINGPRWMLRATILGPPAIDSELAAEWETALRQVGVRRGDQPMASGQPLPVEVPEGARRVEPSTKS